LASESDAQVSQRTKCTAIRILANPQILTTAYTPPVHISSAIDHRTQKTGLPVRSAIHKLCAGTLVVGWVTTSESVLLIVFVSGDLRYGVASGEAFLLARVTWDVVLPSRAERKRLVKDFRTMWNEASEVRRRDVVR
jgi:hypothetical protein